MQKDAGAMQKASMGAFAMQIAAPGRFVILIGMQIRADMQKDADLPCKKLQDAENEVQTHPKLTLAYTTF
ncbi:MAG: hypothetical protein GY822_14500 [Deltaproteobacteria bacterium]|nr:hypothetical protein [Deltaproteobacteria bacterium]